MNKIPIIVVYSASHQENIYEPKLQEFAVDFPIGQTIMKAVINKDQNCCKTIADKCNTHNLHIDNSHVKHLINDRVCMYRSTVRNLSRRAFKIYVRNREPSRIPVQKVLRMLRKRKLRKKFKRSVRISTPTSSKLYQ